METPGGGTWPRSGSDAELLAGFPACLAGPPVGSRGDHQHRDKVLALHEFRGRGRESGLPIRGMRGAALFTFERPRVVRLELFTDQDAALEAEGVQGDGARRVSVDPGLPL